MARETMHFGGPEERIVRKSVSKRKENKVLDFFSVALYEQRIRKFVRFGGGKETLSILETEIVFAILEPARRYGNAQRGDEIVESVYRYLMSDKFDFEELERLYSPIYSRRAFKRLNIWLDGRISYLKGSYVSDHVHWGRIYTLALLLSMMRVRPMDIGELQEHTLDRVRISL